MYFIIIEIIIRHNFDKNSQPTFRFISFTRLSKNMLQNVKIKVTNEDFQLKSLEKGEIK